MRKLFLVFCSLCNCCLYAQLPVIPIPQVSNLGAYGVDIQSPSSVPHTTIPSQTNTYNPNESTRQKQKAQQEIDIAITTMQEIKERQNMALYLIQHGFPPWNSEQGTEYFHNAYKKLSKMLCDSIPSNLEQAVFLVENAYLDNKLNFDNFQRKISERVDYCKWQMKELNLNPNDGLVKNMVIFSLLTDTLNIKQPGTEKTITHYPLKQ